MAILSIDIGTTNIKSILVDQNKIVKKSSVKVLTQTEGKKMTQNAEHILRSVNDILISMSFDESVSHVVLSTPMHTLVYLDENFKPVSGMIIWCDRRSEFAFDDLTKKERDNIYQKTGTPLHSMNPLSKLLMRKNDVAYIADLKAYLMVHLTGHFVTDYSSASASGLWNLNSKAWDDSLLNLVELHHNQLPELVEIDTVFDSFDSKRKVIIGGTDGVMSNRAMGSTHHLVISIGTSVGVRYLSDMPQLGRGFCYYAGFNQWIIGSASNNGGNLFGWLSENFSEKEIDFDEMINILEEPMTSQLCIPYVFGERGPWWCDGLNYQAGEMSFNDRIQSLIFSMFTNITMMIDCLGVTTKTINVTGGFLRDKRLRNIFGNFLGYNIIYTEEDYAVNFASLNLIQDFSFDFKQVMSIPQQNNEYLNYRMKAKEYITNYVKQQCVNKSSVSID